MPAPLLLVPPSPLPPPVRRCCRCRRRCHRRRSTAAAGAAPAAAGAAGGAAGPAFVLLLLVPRPATNVDVCPRPTLHLCLLVPHVCVHDPIRRLCEFNCLFYHDYVYEEYVCFKFRV